MKMSKWYSFIWQMCTPRYMAEEGGGGDGGDGEGAATGFDFGSVESEAWISAITGSDKFKDSSVAMNTKGPEDALEQLLNAQKLLGKNRLPEPEDGWTDDDWAALHGKIGRPEKAEDYKFEAPGDFPLNDDALKGFREVAHKAGFSEKQFKTAMDYYTEMTGNVVTITQEQSAAASEKVTNELKQQYGEKYPVMVSVANDLITEFGGEEFYKHVGSSELGNDPRFVGMMMKLASKFSDDNLLSGESIQNLGPANNAKRQIAQLKEDKSFSTRLTNSEDPGHQDAVKRWHELHRLAYPGTINQTN